MKPVLILLTGILLLLPAAASAQKKGDTGTRTVQGVVTDPSDTPVANAVVKLENMKTQAIRSYITKDDGSYKFFELSTENDYKVHADFQGASSPSKTISSFDSRREVVMNLKLNKK